MKFLEDVFYSEKKQNLITSLSPNDCLYRLKNNTARQNILYFLFSIFKNSEIVGTFDGYGFRIYKREYGRRGNQAFYSGKLKSKGRGTMIDGYFGVPRLSLEMTNLQTDNLLRFLINTLDANVAED